ncbi:MAG: SPFH domain-containing protein [Planctomycetota bacterium]|nr:SPFH domain-containing protein [Planctomycetota bacterium]MDA1214831.1 SPFH domain-containing protein [Planctomycetota bacterium]
MFREKLNKIWVIVALLIVAGLAAGSEVINWTINYHYVPVGMSMRLRYKGPPLPFLPGNKVSATAGTFAKVDDNGHPLEVGVLENMVGPGRHFYSPFWWECKLVEDFVVKPGEIGIASSKMGADLPVGEFLVEGDLGATKHKGIVRRVFGPGRYRINDYAYKFDVIKSPEGKATTTNQHNGWLEIPAGHIGVVTNLTGDTETGAKKGIQDQTLPPGLYAINPAEQKVDLVNIGYRELSLTANLKTNQNGDLQFDESGEPMIDDVDSGITFPSKDGFKIQMDFTAIWGILPEQAPEVIRKFGNVEAVESKVIGPQIESICRNMGSKVGAVDLLVGETRQSFQDETTEAFKSVLEEKDLSLLYGLVRHMYIPREVRVPIQLSNIANELKLTRDQEQLTAKTEANLREEEQKVELETQRTELETTKLVAEAIAEGNKTAEQTKAETQQKVASIAKETAELDAQAVVLLGRASADAEKLMQEAKSQKFQLAVDAFGSGEAYNQWVFAEGLPDDIKLNLLYAGQGTFWTDLKGFTDVMLGRQVKQDEQNRDYSPPVKPTGTSR